MGPTWGPSGAVRTQMGPMLAPWTLVSGITITKQYKTLYIFYIDKLHFVMCDLDTWNVNNVIYNITVRAINQFSAYFVQVLPKKRIYRICLNRWPSLISLARSIPSDTLYYGHLMPTASRAEISFPRSILQSLVPGEYDMPTTMPCVDHEGAARVIVPRQDNMINPDYNMMLAISVRINQHSPY